MHHTFDHISYVGQQNGHPPLRHEHIHNKYIFAAMTNNHLSGMQRFTLCYRLPNAFHIETALMVPKVSYLGWSQAIPTQWQNLTSWGAMGHMLLAATKQFYEWYFLSVCPSVRPSVRLSVCHTFLTMFPSSYHHEIFRSYHIGPG